MSQENQWPIPVWVAELPDVERKSAETRYLLGVAANYCCDRGNISRLARTLGTSVQSIHSAIDRGQVSAEMAISIEKVLGRKHFPRELFRPDLFTLPEE